MKDKYDREIDYIRLSVTDKCDLGCIYCMPGRRPKGFDRAEVLRADEIRRIVKAAMKFGVRKIRLTGGEPLLRHDIVRLVGMVKEAGVPDLSLTTNGTRLARMAGALRDSGLDRVNISLDTMDPGRYREMTGGGDIEAVQEGISAAERAGLSPVKINMVPIRGINDDEVEAFARLTFEKPWHIRFIEFMPSGRKGLWDRSKVVPSAELMERISDMAPLRQRRFRGKGPSRNYVFDGAKGMIGFISPVSHNFCYCCNRLRVSATGRIRPCLFSRTEIDVCTPMRNGAGDDELERLLALAIELKPEGNYLSGKTDVALDSMSAIGG